MEIGKALSTSKLAAVTSLQQTLSADEGTSLRFCNPNNAIPTTQRPLRLICLFDYLYLPLPLSLFVPLPPFSMLEKSQIPAARRFWAFRQLTPRISVARTPTVLL